MPAPAERELLALLNVYSNRALGQITAAQHRPGFKGPDSRERTIVDLARVLSEPARIRKSWQELSAEHRAVVTALLQRGGQAAPRVLDQALTGPAPKGARLPDVVKLLPKLTQSGLVFAVGPVFNPFGQAVQRELDDAAAQWIIPEGVRRHLPAAAPLAPAALRVVTIGAQRESSAREFQRDLYLYWSYVRDHRLPLTLKGEPVKPELKNLNATLLVRAALGKGQGELEHPRLRFVRVLLRALGALDWASQVASVQATAQTDIFSLPPAERVQRCYELWRAGDFFNEVLLLPAAIRLQRSGLDWQMAPSQVVTARQTTLSVLGRLAGAGEWVAVDDLLEAVRAQDDTFLLPRAPVSPYINYPVAPFKGELLGLDLHTFDDEDQAWDVAAGNFIRGLLTGPLSWQGLVDLAWPEAASMESAPPGAFRLTALGRWLFSGGPQPEIPVTGGRVIVQPNLHIVALDPVDDATLIDLDRFAERLSAERAVEYRLTRASVYAGQRQGWGAGRIQAFLKQHVGGELPGNVVRTLEEWQAQHERIVLRPRAAIVHGPAADLDRLLAEAPANLAGARLTPEVLRLSGPAMVEAAAERLAAQGVLPVVNRQAGAPPNSVQASAAGELRLLTERPNLYLHGHLNAFADSTEPGVYQMSAASLARAVRAGLDLAAITARLQNVHRGPLPDGLLVKLKAWSGYYGQAGLESVLLVQVKDAATLAELRADPELASLLQPFEPVREQVLAEVRPEALERVRALLAERGVEVHPKLRRGKKA